jgi:hypothetical protein
MFNRLVVNWVYGGFLAGLLILLITPILARGWPTPLLATFLCLPAYMLHQYEEHDNDRFRRFVNSNFGKGREILSLLAVLLINVPGVWGVIAVAFWLAALFNPGFGLIAAYLLLLNAAIHILSAALLRGYRKTRVDVSRNHYTGVDATNRERRPCTQARKDTGTLVLLYNPGLVTGVLFFVPLGVWCVIAIQQTGFGSAGMHVIGLLAAIGIHAAIAIPVILVARAGVRRPGFTPPSAAPRGSR